VGRRRHHVVSRGYQRFFAEGEHVLLIDKEPVEGRPRVRRAGTRDVFVRDNFNSYRRDGVQVDDIEDEWSRLETMAFPPLRAWIDGNETPTSRNEAKVLAALHFARSYGLRTTYGKIAAAEKAKAIINMPTDPGLIAAWNKDRGVDPDPAEVEALINRFYDSSFGPESHTYIERMAHSHNVAIDKLKDLNVQAVMPLGRRSQFILSDSPFLYFSADRLRVGARQIALFEAAHLFLPLAPKLGVFFTSEPEQDLLATPQQVQELNLLSMRAAFSQVISHPSADLDHALAATPGTFPTPILRAKR